MQVLLAACQQFPVKNSTIQPIINPVSPTSTLTQTNTLEPSLTPSLTTTIMPTHTVVLQTSTPTTNPLVYETLKPGKIVEHFPTDKNLYSFYTYFPKSAIQKRNITIVVWPHGGNMPEDDYDFHMNQAKNTVEWLKDYSETYQMPLLVVAIPRVHYLYVHVLHPGTFNPSTGDFLRRPDLKLIDAVWNQYRPQIQSAGLKVDERVNMMGFSSPGMFTHRFAMIHPERIKAIWICGEEPAPIPAEELNGIKLNYPLGTNDFESLMGTPFDFEEYQKIPHLICVGENDHGDVTKHTDIWTYSQALFILSNFGETHPDQIQSYYDYLVSVNVQAEFIEYKGIGHQTTDYMLKDAFDFFVSKE